MQAKLCVTVQDLGFRLQRGLTLTSHHRRLCSGVFVMPWLSCKEFHFRANTTLMAAIVQIFRPSLVEESKTADVNSDREGSG